MLRFHYSIGFGVNTALKKKYMILHLTCLCWIILILFFIHSRREDIVINNFSFSKDLASSPKYKLHLPLRLPIHFHWSIFNTLPPFSASGQDIPDNEESQMYPQDKTVPAGANTTFCCIVGEEKSFKNIRLENTVMAAKRISRRTYTTTVGNLQPLRPSGTNIICYDDPSVRINGAVVFVGCKMSLWNEENWS